MNTESIKKFINNEATVIKDKAITFKTYAIEESKELRGKAIENIHKISDVFMNCMGNIKDGFSNLCTNFTDKVKKDNDSSDNRVKAYTELLKDENLSKEQKDRILDELFSEQDYCKDSSSKTRIIYIASYGMFIGSILFAISKCTSFLGIGTEIKISK